MNSLHLTPDGNRWTVTAEGSGELLGSFDTKEEAVSQTTAYMAQRTGSLKIHKADGTIEEERTYPRSADPVRSPG